MRRKTVNPKQLTPQRSIQAEEVWRAQVEMLGHVSSTIGHEASNILGALGTCLQILKKNAHLAPDDIELLDILQSGSHRLHQMVSRFAAFKSTPPHLERLDVHELIEEAIALFEGDGRYRSSLLICRRFGALAHHVHADRDQLGEVLSNLCRNAAEAMEGHGRIDIQTHTIGREIEISVRDSGPGIAAAAQANIFEPFYTTKQGRLGLGLAAARCIIEKHKGRIAVASGTAMGTCVVVEIPCERLST